MPIKNNLSKYFSRLNPSNVNRNVDFYEIERLKHLPRYQSGISELMGNQLHYLDSASLISMYNEIIVRGMYEFNSSSSTPFIIDLGANIGLSTIYFKRLFPQSKILAFEADKNVFICLRKNLNSFGLKDIDLINKAVWDSDAFVRFLPEGSDAGRVINDFEDGEGELVETVRLSTFIDRKVDFLKIDIEGAECVVLKEIKDRLFFVERIFIEYHSFCNKPQDLDEILAILKIYGFRYHIQQNGFISGKPFISLKEYLKMDLQLNIFGYRS